MLAYQHMSLECDSDIQLLDIFQLFKSVIHLESSELRKVQVLKYSQTHCGTVAGKPLLIHCYINKDLFLITSILTSA